MASWLDSMDRAVDTGPPWRAEVDADRRLLVVRPTAPNSGISSEGLKEVLDVVSENCHKVQSVSCASCGLGDDAAKVLATWAREQPTLLQEVDLSRNSISMAGFAQLASAIACRAAQEKRPCCQPCLLDLSGNCLYRPYDALEVMRRHGVSVCLMAKCSRKVCVVGAPLHVCGLDVQTQPKSWGVGQLVDLLSGQQQLLPPPLANVWRSKCPPERARIPPPPAPAPEPADLSPLSFRFRPFLGVGSHVCLCGPAGAKAGALNGLGSGQQLTVVGSSPLATLAFGKVLARAECGGQVRAGWVDVRNLAPV